jgi:hypothetical protein
VRGVRQAGEGVLLRESARNWRLFSKKKLRTKRTYCRLCRICPGIRNVVAREFQRARVERCKELLGEGYFSHFG